MLFGHKDSFAIEAYYEPSGPQWAGFGRMCLLVANQCLGDIQEKHCSLFDTVDRFRARLIKTESLWHKSFSTLSDKDIFAVIDNAIYINGINELGLNYHPYDFLTNAGEHFNNYKIFLICRPVGQVTFIYRLPDDTVASACCDITYFQGTVRSFIDWFDGQLKIN